MKILNLTVNGYKNLKEKTVLDLSSCTNYAAFIGLNGSGKSNILEAVSLIFSVFYHNKSVDFKYNLKYVIDNKTVTLTDGKLNVEGVAKAIPKKDFELYLPNNIITSYSGEELRLWEEVYLDSYAEFFKDLKKKHSAVPDLLYINKYSWEIALITLLCSDKPQVKKFINEVLRIGVDVDIIIELDNSKYGLYETNEALSLVKRISSLKEQAKGGIIHINEIRTLDLNQQSNLDFCKKIFYFLFVTSMPEKGPKVNIDKIIQKISLQFNGYDVKKLSEGEKKLILITCINDILSDKNTLVLLDEPDSHIHIERKKAIKNLVEKNEHFTLLTTHSPSLLNCFDEHNIFILSDKDENGVIPIKADKQKHLSEISGGEFSLMNATMIASTQKDILLVEGTNDYNYLNEALKRFKTDYPSFNFLMINCGGAGNVGAILEQSILPILSDNQFCLCLFDEDGAGKNGMESVQKMTTEKEKKNIKCLLHPRHSSFPEDMKEFFMEDYFDVTAYRDLITAEIAKKQKFRDYEQMPKAKGVIESNYKKFPDSAYNNFKVFLDKILEEQSLFHSK